eukprot:scaffold37644_cov67-Phaeocystis_antarctica.AAC.3
MHGCKVKGKSLLSRLEIPQLLSCAVSGVCGVVRTEPGYTRVNRGGSGSGRALVRVQGAAAAALCQSQRSTGCTGRQSIGRGNT